MVLDRLDDVKESLEAKIDASILSQEFSVKQLTDKIKSVEKSTTQAHEKGDMLKEENLGLKARLNTHGTRLCEIEERIEQIERERRRNILIIDGLIENEGERISEVLDRIFVDLKVEFTAKICIAVFRRGKQPSDNGANVNRTNERERADRAGGEGEYQRPRPLVVIFPSVAEKAAVFRNLKNLQGNESWSRVYFNDDLTETQANEQRDIRALAAFAKTKGYNVRVKAGNLLLDGRNYRYQDIEKLPGDVSLALAKTLHILDDKAVVFQSQHSPLSNLYPCNIIYRGEVYLSSESAFQHTRAIVCNHKREALLIKAERRAYKVKRIAKGVKSTKEWEDMSEQVMREILIDKYRRNEVCARALLATGDRTLFEGTGDRRWGCGIPISKASQISFKNPGRNLLGHLLEEVRRLILQKTKQ